MPATNTDVEAALGQVHLDVGVKGLKEGINVAAIPRLESLAGDIHVLLRHRLLLEADGVEGFGCGLEEVDADHEAVSEPVHHPLKHLAPDSARLPAS